MASAGNPYIEVETIGGRWIFSELEIGFDGQRPVQMTIYFPHHLDVTEANEIIGDAIEKCYKHREQLAFSGGTTFDVQEFLSQELLPYEMQVLPSTPEAWHSLCPPRQLQ